MSSLQTSIEEFTERRDLPLEQAFQAATDSSIIAPNTLQRALFPFLSSQDIGLLIQTGPAAGRLEAVFVPVMTGSRDATQLQRLFIIASDDSLTDDYLYRLSPYLRSLAVFREQPLTLFIEGDTPLCRRYSPDGSSEDDVCDHPLDVGIDVSVATYSRFRSLFFGAGGVHAIPGALESSNFENAEFSLKRRDLFYFDEAHSYDRAELRGFTTLVEFLYAEDMDVLIGTSTLPHQLSDDFNFVESLEIKEAGYQPPRTIRFLPDNGEPFIDLASRLVKERYFQGSRLGVVFESPDLADRSFDELIALYPQGVFKYHSGIRPDARFTTYAQIRELEKEGEGYLLITDGTAISNSDIDINLLITGICSPEMLVRRAGRCNRRSDLPNGELLVLGAGGYTGRPLLQNNLDSYLSALQAAENEPDFRPDYWMEFAV